MSDNTNRVRRPNDKYRYEARKLQKSSGMKYTEALQTIKEQRDKS